ncbi:sugar transferase [Evansella cellulosilytica]|uniref:Exopolysaccharide biosynthesis polyprenyl glycosylphosphotransferase n=1 Tax=Evansella cellulosilytica (strain ATCC 21833 / DSM 2522 / FERM P-1141 / JCM 9156 / N-4) TaxID=649639 RepID=E6TSB1_EVAC2|nr:sugar transferase [Evansella cellulosilytica]ADU31880.1 exopolysaccharide biosynthesis polyprenyl glycosylphosphotransferase [Evansella cellulosilytica DSM 2522]
MSTISELRNHKILIILGDLLCILIAYVGAFYLRYFDFPERNWESFISLLPWILLIGLFFISVYELYALDRKNTLWDIGVKVFIAVTFMVFLTMSASYLFREFAMPRSVILIAYFLMIFLLLSFKGIYLKLTRGNVVGNVLLIGNDEDSDRLMAKIKHPMLKGTRVKHISPNMSINKIDRYLKETDYVILCPSISKEQKSKIIYHAMEFNKIVYVIPTLYELLLQRSTVSPLDDTMVMTVKPFGLTLDQTAVKRVFDFLAASMITILVSPILLIVAIIIKFEDPKGKIIYSQERLGKNNKPFMIYKFRSMIEGAEKESGPVLATENDARITKVGKFMRATRLDELPQLFNVIKGDMSLVGPRPERGFFIKQLSKEHYHYMYRNTVQPGITGYAQIMGKYSTKVEDKLRFDLYYIRNYTFWLDIVILLKTFIVLFDKTKAEGTEDPSSQKSKEKSVKYTLANKP